MKHIFDAIRNLVAYKQRGFRESHALLMSLTFLERRLRGFSNRLNIICGEKALSESDQLLQTNLRTTVEDTIQFLCQDFARFDEAKRAGEGGPDYEIPEGLQRLLSLKDTSGYLRVSAYRSLRAVSEWRRHQGSVPHTVRVSPDLVALDNSALRIRYRIHVEGDNSALSRVHLTNTYTLDNIDLDSLGGAATACLRVREQVRQQLKAAPTVPELVEHLDAVQKQEQLDAERNQRIRNVLSGLSAEDRAYLRRLANGMSSSSLRAYFN